MAATVPAPPVLVGGPGRVQHEPGVPELPPKVGIGVPDGQLPAYPPLRAVWPACGRAGAASADGSQVPPGAAQAPPPLGRPQDASRISGSHLPRCCPRHCPRRCSGASHDRDGQLCGGRPRPVHKPVPKQRVVGQGWSTVPMTGHVGRKWWRRRSPAVQWTMQDAETALIWTPVPRGQRGVSTRPDQGYRA